MHQADAEEAAGFFHIEVLGEIQGVIIAVPGEESVVAELGGEFEWRVAINADGKGPASIASDKEPCTRLGPDDTTETR